MVPRTYQAEEAHMSRAWSRTRGQVVLLVVLAVALAACGDDGDETETGQTATTAAGAGAAPVAAGSTQEYCARVLRIETLIPPEIDFAALSPEQQKEEARKLASQTYLPLAEEAQQVTPAEVRADAELLLNAIREVGRTGEFEAVFARPEVDQAEKRLHAFDLRTCGWPRTDVTAVDYAFQGAPTAPKPGPMSFELSNQGKEPHELAVVRINDDVKESMGDILKLPEAEGRKKVKEVGNNFAEPGQSEYVVVDLKPGRYGFICAVPVGGRDGPPHFTRGMFSEFTVA